MSPPLREIVERLSKHFGPRHWWPAETPFEVMVGAVLAQNTAWSNVERAIANLKSEGALDPEALLALPDGRLEELIRPSGYFRQKARKLRVMVEWFLREHGGEIEALRNADMAELRGERLDLWGIGPETADSILCYAAGHTVFVVDAYTVRALARHGMVPPRAKYDAVQDLAHAQLPRETAYLNEAHALFVALGKYFCRGRRPLCEGCPLEELLPEGGAVV